MNECVGPRSDLPMLMFAYGSNMLTARIQARIPTAMTAGRGCLPGFRLEWTKPSKDGSGKCTVTECSEGSVVHGVLYEVPEEDKLQLDRAEGLGYGYAEQRFDVHTDAGTKQAVAYVATDTNRDLLPYEWYKAFVVCGAKEHGLPPDYLAFLEECAAKQDPDMSRDAENRAVISSF